MATEHPNTTSSTLFKLLTKESLERIEGRSLNTNAESSQNQGSQPNARLREGKLLGGQAAIGFNNDLVGKPLEDIDPFFLDDKTFVIVNKKKEIFRFTSAPALWLMSPLNIIRHTALQITTNIFFHYIMMTIIAVHFWVMMMPPSPNSELIGLFFNAIYTVELTLKVAARGFIMEKFTYLHDGWNWLDFILTLIAYLALLPGFGSLEVFLPLRILRLLRIKIVGVQNFVDAIFRSFKNLLEVGILTLFFLFVFAVIGLQIYMGVLKQKCVKNPAANITEMEHEWNHTDQSHYSSMENWLYNEAIHEFAICGSASPQGCPEGYTCVHGYGPSPNYGFTAFDNFGLSFLSIFRVMMLDYWEMLLQQIVITAGPWHVIFFVVVIFIGRYFFVSLFMVTVVKSYLNILQEKIESNENEPETSGATQHNDTQLLTENLQCAVEDFPIINQPGLSDGPEVHVPIFDSNRENGKQGWCSLLCDKACIWECGPPWSNIQESLLVIVSDPFFHLFIATTLVVNTILFAMDYHGIYNNRELQKMLYNGNMICTYIYFIEASMKILAASPKNYFKVGWNRFDFVVTVIPFIEMLFEDVNLPGILALRMLRLAKFWPTTLLMVFGRLINGLISFTYVSFILISTFAIVGMQMFSKSYFDAPGEFPGFQIPRWNLTDFWHSWMVIFRILCGEWIETMWDCMLVVGPPCNAFTFVVVLVCNLVLLPLYLALVFQVMCEDNFLQLKRWGPGKLTGAFERIGRLFRGILFKSRRNTANRTSQPKNENVVGVSIELETRNMAEDKPIERGSLGTSTENLIPDFRNPENKWALLVQSKYFDGGIMIMVVVSCIALMLEDIHLKDKPVQQKILISLDRFFMIVFFLEMLTKWAGLGFKNYFGNKWCILEFFIVMVTLQKLTFEIFGCSQTTGILLWAARSFRVFRPLMIISNWKHMRVLLNTLAKSVRPVSFVIIISAFFWLFFAIWGIHLFSGKFYKCIDDKGNAPHFIEIPSRDHCIRANYSWENSYMNFDHVGRAYLSLFQVGTFKGWILIKKDAVDSRREDEQPHREINFVMYTYFVLFILIAAFPAYFSLASVFLNTYTTVKKEDDREKGSSPEVLETYSKALIKMKGRRQLKVIPQPTWKPQIIVFKIVTNRKFEAFFTILICLNVIFMSMDHYQQSQIWEEILTFFNLVFTAIFAIEALVKIFALRKYYFTIPWNVFDFIVAVLSVLGLLLSDVIHVYFVSPTLLRIIRIARVARLIGLFNTATCQKIKQLLRTFSASVRPLLFICILFTCIIYVYAIFGMNIFQNVRLTGGLDSRNNFRTFSSAFLMLVQLSTAAGWDGVFDGISREEDCDLSNPEFGVVGDCGSHTAAVNYLVSYVFIGYFILLNLILAVIYAHYSETCDNVNELTEEDFEMFDTTWSQFDPNMSKSLQIEKLSDFLHALNPPLQIAKPNESQIAQLDIPIYTDGMIKCDSVLEALVANFYAAKDNNASLNRQQRDDPASDMSSLALGSHQEENSTPSILNA